MGSTLIGSFGEPVPTELVWLVPTIFSSVGLMSVWVTSKYIHASLKRQGLIVNRVLDPRLLGDLNAAGASMGLRYEPGAIGGNWGCALVSMFC